MPFTGSHPAAILPFARWGLPASALVVGSMAPDVPYYVAVPLGADLTHSLIGVVTVDILVGLAMFALWQAVLGPAAVAYAPVAVSRRVSAPVGLTHHLGNTRRFLLTVVALVVGATTHVVWDAFTHGGRWGSAHISWLAIDHGPLAGYSWAQYLSGVAGAAVLTVWCVRWWRRAAEHSLPDPAVSTKRRLLAWAMLGVVALSGGIHGMVVGSMAGGVRRGFFLAATHGTTAAFIAAVLVASLRLFRVACRRWRRVRHREYRRAGSAAARREGPRRRLPGRCLRREC
jgi:hypothetical protein